MAKEKGSRRATTGQPHKRAGLEPSRESREYVARRASEILDANRSRAAAEAAEKDAAAQREAYGSYRGFGYDIQLESLRPLLHRYWGTGRPVPDSEIEALNLRRMPLSKADLIRSIQGSNSELSGDIIHNPIRPTSAENKVFITSDGYIVYGRLKEPSHTEDGMLSFVIEDFSQVEASYQPQKESTSQPARADSEPGSEGRVSDRAASAQEALIENNLEAQTWRNYGDYAHWEPVHPTEYFQSRASERGFLSPNQIDYFSQHGLKVLDKFDSTQLFYAIQNREVNGDILKDGGTLMDPYKINCAFVLRDGKIVYAEMRKNYLRFILK